MLITLRFAFVMMSLRNISEKQKKWPVQENRPLGDITLSFKLLTFSFKKHYRQG